MSHLPHEGFITLREKPVITSVDNFREMTYKAQFRLDQLGQSTKGAEKRTSGNVAAVYPPPRFSNKENQPDQNETRRNTNNYDNSSYRRNDASKKAPEDFNKKKIICFNCFPNAHADRIVLIARGKDTITGIVRDTQFLNSRIRRIVIDSPSPSLFYKYFHLLNQF